MARGDEVDGGLNAVTPDLFRRADAIFDAALDLPEEERAAFADRTCANDVPLRNAVRRLLEAHQSAEAFLAAPAVEMAAHLLAGVGTLRGQTIRAPSRVGPFRVVREIGHGGMGQVYLGERDDGEFEQLVAIKFLRPAADWELSVERFRSERRILAMLNHPNIARMLDGGLTDDGLPYLVMEYVDGLPIDVYCQQRQLSTKDRLRLFLHVIDAVDCAHRNLIVHRDLKPSNVMVTSDGTVKLLDFGLAKLLQLGTSLDRALTRTGHRVMTPHYAAPEQVRGTAVTTLTDVYQLGAVLYALLATQTPFASYTSSLHELEMAVLERDPAPLGGDLRGDVSAIVMHAMRKEPEQRYPSVRELAADIRRHLDGHPVLARRHTISYVTRRFVRRNRTALAVTTAMAMVLALYVVETRRERDEARRQRDRALYQERRATASSAFMQTLLGTVAPDERFRTFDLLERARQLLERDYSDDPHFVARMLVELSVHYEAIANLAVAEAILRRAADLARKSGDVGTLAEAECLLVDRIANSRNLPSMAARLQQTLRELEAVRGATASPLQCLLAQARIADLQGHPDSAILLSRQALSMARAAGDTASMGYAELLAAFQAYLAHQRRFREALEPLRERIALLHRIGRAGSIMAVRARIDEAQSMMFLGELRTAESLFVASFPAALRADSTYAENFVALPLAALAEAMGRPDSAARIFRYILEVAARRGEKDRYFWTLERLAVAEADAGDIALARRHLAAADSGPPNIRGSPLNRARVEEAAGNAATALTLYKKAIVSMKVLIGPSSRWPRVPALAARAALSAGDIDAADTLASHAQRLARAYQQDEPRSADIGTALFLQARARLAMGDFVSARRLLIRAMPGLEHGLGPNHPQSRAARVLLASLPAD